MNIIRDLTCPRSRLVGRAVSEGVVSNALPISRRGLFNLVAKTNVFCKEDSEKTLVSFVLETLQRLPAK